MVVCVILKRKLFNLKDGCFKMDNISWNIILYIIILVFFFNELRYFFVFSFFLFECFKKFGIIILF